VGPRLAGRVLAVVLLAAASGACRAHDPSSRNEPPRDDAVAIELTAEAAGAWAYGHEAGADLDGDGSRETVVLASDVRTSPSGVPLWEDGHRWALTVSSGADVTLLYAAFVPNGFVEAAVEPPSSDGTREILVLERTPGRLRVLTLAYAGPGQAPPPASVAHYSLEGWLPGSARLPR
jgi:hypothetical protein